MVVHALNPRFTARKDYIVKRPCLKKNGGGAYVMYISLCGYVHQSAGACGGLRCQIPWSWVESQSVVNYLMWVLGTELGFSGKAMKTLNC